jgi:exodeoxyribonuclease V alpha subunit
MDKRLARRATGLLRVFNDAGVLSAADVHVVQRLGVLAGESAEPALLAAALAVRAPRLAHVCVDLATIRQTATSELDEPVDVRELPWPEVPTWVALVGASPLVGVGGNGSRARPLRLEGERLYLDRYWRQEVRLAADLLGRCQNPPTALDQARLDAGLAHLFPGSEPNLQRDACRAAVSYRFSVVAGGPGTGKTTTVARVLALLDEQAAAQGRRPPRVALSAPTGKAAARLEESVHAEAVAMSVPAGVRDRLLASTASTLHRLLGWRPGNASSFRHDRASPLPHDVVVVDETSMVPLSLMASLVEAVRPDARLVLVGDPDQLASIEAGAVLGDIVGPAGHGTGVFPADVPIGRGIVVLQRVHRFGGEIAALAAAVKRGDGDDVVDILRAGRGGVRWIASDVGTSGAFTGIPAELEPVRERVVEAGRGATEAARTGRARDALAALRAARVLCAHRRGPYGVAVWTSQVERWLTEAIDGYGSGGPWYVGRPLLITQNDYALRLYNGDTGVVVDGGEGRPVAVFERGTGLLEVGPRRLAAVDTVHAMTVHKSQGSQFDTVAVILPDASSPILTRELLYTAITRAQTELILVGSEDAVRDAVEQPIARATGLRERLWG